MLSCWGSRLAWTAQRELAAQVIRGVEAHKAAATFLRTTAVRMDPSTVPRTMVNGQWGELSNCRTGGYVICQGGGVAGDGLARVGLAGDGLAGDGYVQGPTL